MSDSNEPNQLEQSTITMLDVLEEETEMEEEYAAVLGGSDENECTYAKGAIDRQALYSCLTCCPEARTDPTKSAGICLACSYRCHENHELIELYTKRNFRCDCPTLRLGAEKRCALNPQLDALPAPNAENFYNHNFQGLYCKCKRPYPDPERTDEEVMLQCVICEDWFHLQHMQSPPISKKWLDACSEMICDNCMERNQFLCDYIGLALQPAEQKEGKSESDVNVCVGNEQEAKGTKSEPNEKSELESESKQKKSELEPASNGAKCEQSQAEAKQTKSQLEPESKGTKNEQAEAKSELESASNGEKIKQSQAEAQQTKRELESESESKADPGEPAQKRTKLSEEICRRPKRNTEYKGAAFWANDWRAALCQCSTCMQLYREQSVEFLLDAKDSVKAYEERGKKRGVDNSTYQQAIRALASIDRTKQIDVITEYNRMGDRLKEFLQSFASSNRVVTEDDIKGFFAGMRSENHANRGMPYFCR